MTSAPIIHAPFAFVADIIVKNNEPYFLELGDLNGSGLDGYNALYGGDLHHKIETHLNDITHPRAGDDNATLGSICDDKGLFYALFTQNCPSLFPTSRIYPLYKLNDQIHTIIQDFSEHENIVFKHRNMARGEGIYMLSAQTLALSRPADLLENFSLPHSNPLQFNTPARQFSRLSGIDGASSHYVVQSLIEADPITAFDHTYAPVMRLAMTAEPLPDNTLALHHHGAYYKLPATPLERAQTLMQKHLSKMDDTNPAQSTAPVSKDLYEHIKSRLEADFLPALEQVFYTSPLNHVENLMQNPDAGTRMAALAFLTRHRKFDIQRSETLSPAFINKIDNFIDINPAALHFMAARANRTKLWHSALRPLQDRYRDLLIDLPDGTSALSARHLYPYEQYAA